MVDFTSETFAAKAEKLISILSQEENFYLKHFEELGLEFTMFGNGYFVISVPGRIGEEADPERGVSVRKLIVDRFLSEDAMRHMRWVPLPKASELKPGRSKEHPTKYHLTATELAGPNDRLLHWDDPAADSGMTTYPAIAVQERYLKMALQLAKFSGYRDVRSIYNPLYLWMLDDRGHDVYAFIMPMRE